MRSRRSSASNVAQRGDNELSRLIYRRKAELDLTWDDIAERGGFSSHTIVHALATKREHRQTPRLETLERLAKALAVPLDVVKDAAIRAAGFDLQDVPTTLEASADLRIIADCLGRMSAPDRSKLVRLAEAFAAGA